MPVQLAKLSIAALAVALICGQAHAQGFVRMEMIPVPSVTLTTQQFLTGDTNGKPAILAGQLRIPKGGSDKLPAIIMVHGSGGLSASADQWARELNAIGLAVFVLDSFSGRGIVNVTTDQSQLDHLAMMVDAYRALGVLADHPRIDRARVAVIGFSKGSVAAISSSNQRFRRMHGPAGAEFAAHISLYSICYYNYRDDEKLTGKPIRLFHGIADDFVPIEPCRKYAQRLKQAGADVTLTEFPGAYHAYDNPAYAQPIKLPQAQTPRGCEIQEGENGRMLNAKTGQTFSIDDPCIERGAQVAYNETAHKATVAAVKEFLAATFKLKE